jgi:hypothetical protein
MMKMSKTHKKSLKHAKRQFVNVLSRIIITNEFVFNLRFVIFNDKISLNQIFVFKNSNDQVKITIKNLI